MKNPNDYEQRIRNAQRGGYTGAKKNVANSQFKMPPAADNSTLQANGFKAAESQLLHESLQLANMKWFDGDGRILGKSGQFEVTFRAGESQNMRWAVMGFPLYDMNMPNSAEICLHFLAEAYDMIHALDFQYQVGINMETEHLEFLMQLPVAEISAAQLAELISSFFQALAETVMNELSEIVEQLNSMNT